MKSLITSYKGRRRLTMPRMPVDDSRAAIVKKRFARRGGTAMPLTLTPVMAL
jgi:hypothetical protein